MSRTLVLRLTALLAAAVLVLGTGQALAAKSHSVSATGKAAVLGKEGTKTIALGRFLSNLGEIVVVFKTSTLANGNLSSTFVGYNVRGTLRGTALQTPTATANGTTFTGTATVTGGTGTYKGATGKVSALGTQPQGSTVINYKLRGSIRY